MTNLKKQLDKVQGLKQPEQAEQVAFNELLKRIRQARCDYRGIRGLVGDALHLALKDYLLHNNKNSMQQLITTPVDTNSKGRGVYLYNLYEVKEYLASLGLKLEYTAKGGFAMYFREGYEKPTLEKVQSYADFIAEYKAQKKAEQESKPKLSKYEQVKSLIKDLNEGDRATLKGYLASLQ